MRIFQKTQLRDFSQTKKYCWDGLVESLEKELKTFYERIFVYPIFHVMIFENPDIENENVRYYGFSKWDLKNSTLRCFRKWKLLLRWVSTKLRKRVKNISPGGFLYIRFFISWFLKILDLLTFIEDFSTIIEIFNKCQ